MALAALVATQASMRRARKVAVHRLAVVIVAIVADGLILFSVEHDRGKTKLRGPGQ